MGNILCVGTIPAMLVRVNNLKKNIFSPLAGEEEEEEEVEEHFHSRGRTTDVFVSSIYGWMRRARLHSPGSGPIKV